MMRQPTAAEIKAFKAEVKALNSLGKKGFTIFVDVNTMSLLVGDGEAIAENEAASGHVANLNLGQW